VPGLVGEHAVSHFDSNLCFDLTVGGLSLGYVLAIRHVICFSMITFCMSSSENWAPKAIFFAGCNGPVD